MKVTQHHGGNVVSKFDDFGPLGRPAQRVANHTPGKDPMRRWAKTRVAKHTRMQKPMWRIIGTIGNLSD